MDNNEKRFCWSPDGGRFVIWRGKYYWHDGSITDEGPLRMGLMNPAHAEDYTAWSDEERAAVVAKHKAERAARKAENDAYEARMRQLSEQAEAKLTEEEKKALQWAYRD